MKDFKDLTKKQKKHLKEQGITRLYEFKTLANDHVNMRRNNYNIEPCWECRRIAEDLGLPV